MLMRELRDRHSAARAQVSNLREQLRGRRAHLIEIDVATYCRENGRSTLSFSPEDFVCCRTLQGHTGKIYSLDWAQNENRVVSVSQDGRLIVWNALTSQKIHAIKLTCAWAMACAFSPNGQAVACGGLDNVCSIFVLDSQHEIDGKLPVARTLNGHKGYISCCEYVPDHGTQLITSSGDQTCILWDSETSQLISTFGGEIRSGHTADVMSVSISSTKAPTFVSGSCDMTACLWDLRFPNNVAHTFHGHNGDVNTVRFFPDGLRFGTGSDDSTCRIFDIRTGHQLQLYRKNVFEREAVTVNSIAFSNSGRLLFAAYSNGNCYVWDTMTAEVINDLGCLQDAHSARVSCLGLASDGSALCSGSWDKSLKIWTFGGRRIFS